MAGQGNLPSQGVKSTGLYRRQLKEGGDGVSPPRYRVITVGFSPSFTQFQALNRCKLPLESL
ncbi:hypothetical protein CHELA20_51834 [Hyphomicrobiales bacterium]|nr:hypothetical protein CHELA41_23179 [Hyphomicrobiales bacterium]CAH1678831.1 hypothetical protein CHELA20_51834 [Hyphomicrobiales bacterium]